MNDKTANQAGIFTNRRANGGNLHTTVGGEQNASGTSGHLNADVGRKYYKYGVKEKVLIRNRVARLISSSEASEVTASDVFLYPSGMNAISDVYRALLLGLAPRKVVLPK